MIIGLFIISVNSILTLFEFFIKTIAHNLASTNETLYNLMQIYFILGSSLKQW